MDSRNLSTLAAARDEDIEALHEELLQQRPQEVQEYEDNLPASSREWMSYARRDSIRSNALVVGLLHDCIVGNKDLLQELLEINIGGFVETFNTHVVTKMQKRSEDKKEDCDEDPTWEGSILAWMKAFYPAPVIENNIREMITNYGTEHLTPTARSHLKEWAETVQEHLDFSQKAISDDLLRLSRVVSWLSDHVLADSKGKL